MLFPTVEFACFFVVVFCVSWALHRVHSLKKLFLIAASFVFYGFWDWRFILLLVGSAFQAWACSLIITRARDANPGTARPLVARMAVAASLFISLASLVFFKYTSFFMVSGNNILEALGAQAIFPVFEVILPVGISFFTFHAMSYVIDVYRGDYRAFKNFADITLYLSFFPHLVAGPIVRAGSFLPQLQAEPDSKNLEIDRALVLILGGLFKKVVLANYVSTLFVDSVFSNPGSFGSADLLLGVYGYAVQIYCDFSAYTDIAIGVALLLGYRFPQNFDKPYRSQSLQEFWRRWHMSLSSWLRDYLYISLGGNRKGRIRTYVNLILTMLLGGLWHGASWTFVLWGLVHGVGLAFERAFRARSSKAERSSNLLVQALKVIVTFNVVCFAWILFRSPNLERAGDFLQGLFSFRGSPGLVCPPFVLALIVGGIALHFVPDRVRNSVMSAWKATPFLVQGLLFTAGIILIGASSPAGVAPFIYFQF